MLTLSQGTSGINAMPFRTPENLETVPLKRAVQSSTVSMQSPSLTRVLLPFGVNTQGSTHRQFQASVYATGGFVRVGEIHAFTPATTKAGGASSKKTSPLCL